MSDIPLDEVVHFDVISSSSTGAAVDADSTPTFAVYEEDTDTGLGVGGNLTKRTSLTGNYRGSFTASAANGFELGKWYNVIASATIGGVACKGVALRFRIVAAEVVPGYPVIDAAKWLGQTIAAVTTSGIPKVDLSLWLGVAPLALSSQLVQVLDAAGVTTLLNRLTSSRAGYLDNLSAGPVATSAEVTSIQNNTTTSLIAPANILRPASGTLTCCIRVYLTDEVGNMEAPDSAPTLDVRDAAGTDLTARLGSTTGTLEGTGRYRWVYTSTSTDEAEQILFEVTVVEGGLTRMKGVTSWVTDNASTDFTSTDRTKLEQIYNKLPTNSIGDQTLLTASIAGVPDAVDTELSANHGNTAWGAATVIVTPFSATVSGGEVSDSGIITAYQYAAFGPFVITIVDSNDDPIDLRTLDLRFIGYRVAAANVAEKYFEIDDSEMSVGGAGHNVLTVDADDTATQTARAGLWVVRDVTNDRILARGTLKIPAVSDAEAV